MNNLTTSILLVAKWWNPFSWGDALGDAIEAVQALLNNVIVTSAGFALEKMTGLFNTSVNALRSEVAITPAEFDGNMLDILKNISDTVVLPIAILLITYVFVLQIIEFVTDKNKGGEFDVGNVIMLIIKTTIMILLSTNAFTIALGFSDLATWMIDKVPTEQVEISADVSESLLSALEPVVVQTNEDGTEKELEDIDKVENRDTQRMDYKLGEGLLTLMVAGIGFVIVMIICGIIYLVAWSRIIMIFLYVTVAPIPMATVMSDSWVNSIGQNYLKNLMALTIQGFLMLVLMVVYNGLVSRTATLINGGEGGFMGMILIIVSMAIVAKMLIGTHGLAKSITGAS
ncbi:CD0415/CD1112 family protein [Enterococcus faecalis]|uniref:Conjugal transfer protein n=2 Tax=Enterococcus TaxID=1350 RepID=A0A0E3MTG0_ENTFL|nr:MULTISPECIES: CD0415/CD1112 family protein [Enterococcus]AKA86794.1 Hypothetical protein [Enterococcus faecalis]AQM74915.1 hypothetical protein [Enterococcus faecalis]AWH58949.1 hypothetical protein [Enterococcus faecalis]AWH58991.1 hypothetical protein [Enterococcus faecalis]MBB6710048.1 hypothetical protein [Enterococcus faecalis]